MWTARTSRALHLLCTAVCCRGQKFSLCQSYVPPCDHATVAWEGDVFIVVEYNTTHML